MQTKDLIKDSFFEISLLWKQKKFIRSVFLGILLIILSLTVYHFSNIYTSESAVTYVHDIILDNIPVFNVNFVVNEGVWIYIFFMLFFSFKNPEKIPFGLKSIAFFIFIRSLFVSLTHLGPAPIQSFLDPQDWLTSVASGNDLFFSGHTGMPFLLALIFWNIVSARVTSLLASIILGASMLLGHLHYSIDVFAAFFITYSIFTLAKKIFPQDWDLASTKSQLKNVSPL